MARGYTQNKDTEINDKRTTEKRARVNYFSKLIIPLKDFLTYPWLWSGNHDYIIGDNRGGYTTNKILKAMTEGQQREGLC